MGIRNKGSDRLVQILFVCHGNICRSPMAEFVMKDLVMKAGLGRDFAIASAGTSREEAGNPVYPPARKILLQHDIDPREKTARQMQKSDYQKFHYLIGMDSVNLQNLRRFYDGDSAHKTFRLLDLTAKPRDIADPWYTGDFEQTWNDVTEGCTTLLSWLTKTKKEAR